MAAKKPGATPTAPDTPPAPKEARIMDVARILRCRYQKARDLMLGGAFGEAHLNSSGKLVVLEEKVVEFNTKRKEKV